LEQNLRTHSEKTVNNTKCKYKRHGVNVSKNVVIRVGGVVDVYDNLQTEEPRERCNRELDIHFMEALVNER
jgi:hypothetical protein